MSTHQPLLVVTPTLGRSPWLERTVASVSAHAGRLARHVLVAPPAELPDLGRRFPHCMLVPDAAARGVYPAINRGLQSASGQDWQWFTWINDDDELTPGFAPHLARALLHDGNRTDAPWHYGPVRLQSGVGHDLGNLAVTRFSTDIVPLAQCGINPLNQQGLLAPRAWVRRLIRLREDLKICGDLDFWLRAAVAGASFRCSRETVAVFRLRAGQISGDVARHRAEFGHVVQTLSPRPANPFRRGLARTRFRFANAGTYARRLQRSGWKGGFALLRQPDGKSS